ncbi:SigB/SigF/SigG family RNA polymerase sigma factor [Dactylosporangium sp. NPDC005555]|uniref:SigB/SigF/SigG family RNA polymerase sigma factor n=1 Tax=Dactylosporangium sp. NPDC005555 TaxID=3154889 RepID=UPI0033A10F00
MSIDLHTDATSTGTTDSITVPAPEVPAAPAPAAGTHRTRETDAQAKALLSLLGDLPAGADRDRVRARLIELYIPLAEYLARRFRNRGEQFDDLVQVANLGLIKSVDGFDPTRGAAFTSYAIPMIVGELKRHFRDKGWDVRVPRRLQELRLEISKVSGDLAQDLGRSPTVADLAKKLGASEEDVIEGLDCGQAYRALSLDAPVGDGGDGGGATGLGDLLGGDDPDMANVENREALRPLLAKLPAREQKIIAMRFHGNLTQSQIAAELGISQMHVSRLLAGALRTLRASLTRD